MGLQIIYVANILVAGWVGLQAFFWPNAASTTVFSGVYAYSPLARIVGALWLGIALLSVAGLWKPLTFSPILGLQLFYKSIWLLVVALPALIYGQPFPRPMAIFFLIWVLILPWVIPWKHWF